ncbi:FMN-dependent NADH-azoreductase [Sphingobacterium alkalisoli]|uniref:FMN dependent NADH:quinone oxidoreductase n=1 Tax=Sphingobacterium alkalisoli TaxID=1874115 RepID=A0A4U0H9D0_9SPHI|nr:NAD(P)H-dependent oxidoreductase [Sphingobacterium alkalisoli]TJY67102.1 FMN-dependent NADH-azoreductase [Sphingobacterium alkalisoli]GGH12209.1 FMN-dependent NADH-azoreductase [Sphingobacterium alkalisoli]
MKILHIISSPRGEASQTIQLGNSIVKKLVAKNEKASIITRDITTEIVPYLIGTHIQSFNTPPENRSAEQLELIKLSDILIAEVLDADIIVIGAPMYNFGIPAVLKSWIDYLARAGVAFTYTADGPVGLIQGKKVFLAIGSGGVYSEGDYKAFDFIEPYLRTSLGFFGMTDITAFRIEGVSVSALKDNAMQVALEKLSVLD